MLSKKHKGFFLEVNRNSVMVAETSTVGAPMTLDSLREFSRETPDAFGEYMEAQLATHKGLRYIPAHCGVIPVSRFIRRHTVESVAKAKDPEFQKEVMETHLKLDPKKLATAVLNAQDGRGFDRAKSMSNQKELIFCGAERKEMDGLQDELVEQGVFPQSLQLGTLSSAAGLMHYLRSREMTTPVMLLEMTPENANLIIVSSEKVDLCRAIPFGFHSMYPLVQQELGLKDEASAKKLFYSDTFDFTEIGASLLRKALKELQASTGFYEVQTGQTISHLVVTQLPENMKWVPQVLSQEIGIKPLALDYENWLSGAGIETGEHVNLESLSPRWLGVLSLLIGFEDRGHGTAQET